MVYSIRHAFSQNGFMPHGMCYLWQPGIMALHVASDAFIALAYFSIPVTLFYFARKRADFQLKTALLSFAAFITACGTAHLIEIWTIWFPVYWLSGGVKAVTAMISVPTAVLLVKLVPAALRVPSPATLQTAISRLQREIAEREHAEREMCETRDHLERRVVERTTELHDANLQLRHEIQERERADKLFSAILSSIGDGVIVTDSNGRISYCNTAAASLIGSRSKSILSHPFEAFVQQTDETRQLIPNVPTAATGTLSGPIGTLCDATLIKSNGERIPIDLRESPIHTPIADHQTVFTFRDSTARRQAEGELKKINERFSVAANAAGLGFWELDAAANTLLWDEQMFRLYGREPVKGVQPCSLWADSVYPDDREQAERALHAGTDGKHQVHLEFRIMRPNGEIRHLSTSAVVTRNAAGCVRHMFGVSFDITVRKRAAEQLHLTIEAAPTGMIMTNTAGMIKLVNAETERIFGCTRAELLDSSIESLLPQRFRARHPEHRESFYAAPLARKMGAGRDLYGLRRDGTEVPIEIALNPLDTAEGHFILSSVADITERKRGEETLRKLNTDLEEQIRIRTSEVKEREVLLQEIHHRVKNNLQVISSLINMQVRTIDNPSSKTVLRQCQSRVETMARIHEMLYESRNYASVPFAEYAKSLASSVLRASDLTPSSVAIDFELEDVSLAVDKAIPCALILNELIANALKHAFGDKTEKAVVRVGLRSTDNGCVALFVSDNGVGISPDVKLSELRSVGMQIVTTLVAQLDGKLNIVRQSGSMFEVIFPLES
jgi:PAS domain S-box-containing protein